MFVSCELNNHNMCTKFRPAWNKLADIMNSKLLLIIFIPCA